MLDIAQHKIGDRWFLEFIESLTPVDSIEDIRLDHTGTHIEKTEVKAGNVVLLFKSGAWAVRTPVKAGLRQSQRPVYLEIDATKRGG